MADEIFHWLLHRSVGSTTAVTVHWPFPDLSSRVRILPSRENFLPWRSEVIDARAGWLSPLLSATLAIFPVRPVAESPLKQQSAIFYFVSNSKIIGPGG